MPSRHRKIEGLEQADLWKFSPPFPIPKGATYAQRRGLAYERAVGRAVKVRFGNSWAGPWYHFRDHNGKGFCQPDVVLAHDGGVYILEVKLSECDAGRGQLSDLYLPVLRHLYGPCVWGIQVAKYLRPTTQKETLVHTLDDAFEAALTGIPTLWWMGGPL